MMSAAGPASGPWPHSTELWAHALELNEQLKIVGPEIQSFWTDTQAYLQAGAVGAGHPRRAQLYQGIQQNQHRFSTRMEANHARLGVLLGSQRRNHMAAGIKSISPVVHQAAPEKLENEITLAILEKQTDRAFAAPYEWQFLVAAATIPLYRSSILLRDTLGVFLQRPTTSRVLLDVSRKLLKAAAMELVSKTIPFAGALEVLADISTPNIEKQLAAAGRANEFIDRLFLLEDNIAGCVEDAQYAEATLAASETALTDLDQNFDRAISWITGLLA
jgi:hypothetical protein